MNEEERMDAHDILAEKLFDAVEAAGPAVLLGYKPADVQESLDYVMAGPEVQILNAALNGTPEDMVKSLIMDEFEVHANRVLAWLAQPATEGIGGA